MKDLAKLLAIGKLRSKNRLMEKNSCKEDSRKRRVYLKRKDFKGEDDLGKGFNQEYLKKRRSQIVPDSKKKSRRR